MGAGGEQLRNLCFRCGVPIAKPAAMDRNGRAFCATCAGALGQQVGAARDGAQGVVSAARPVSTGKSARASTTVSVSRDKPSQAGGNELELAPLDVAPVDRSTLTRAPCRGCGAKLKVGVQACPKCGRVEDISDPNARRRVRSMEPGKIACHNCGYDMAGVPGTTCPECGTEDATISTIAAGSGSYQRSSVLEEESRAIERAEWRKPLWPVVSSLGVVGILLGVISQRPLGSALVTSYVIGLVPRIGAATLAYVLCGVWWLGLDAPWKLTLWRFVAIVLMCDVVWLLASVVLGGRLTFFVLLASGVVYVGSLVWLFDLDFDDAKLVTWVTFGINLIVGVALAMLL